MKKNKAIYVTRDTAATSVDLWARRRPTFYINDHDTTGYWADGGDPLTSPCAHWFHKCTGIKLKPGEIKRIRLTAEVLK